MKKLFRNIMLMALAAMTYQSCEDVPAPYDKPGTGSNVPGPSNTVIEGATGTGEHDTPYNAIAAINLGNSLEPGEMTAEYVYIQGKVVSIKEEFSTQYGNATFYISEDGSAKNQFYVYRALYLGNSRFAEGDEQIKVGDNVVVCGKVTNYNGTIETAQGSAFLYSLNGVDRGGEPQPSTPAAAPVGDGTLENPYNVSGVLEYIKTLGSDVNSPTQVYVKGLVSQIKEQYGTQYGNGTFYMSDDGKASNEFYVFRALYLGNKRYAEGDTPIVVGDSVIVCGNVVNFRGNTPETVQNSSYLYSLNGVTGGGETTPSNPKGTGTLDDPFNPAGAIAYVQSLGKDVNSPNEVYIKGKVSSIKEQFGTQYGNATFGISEDGKAANEFTAYRVLYLGNKKYTSGDLLKQGDDVVVCGKVVNFRGNTPETVQNTGYLYSLNGKTEAGEQPVIPTIDAKGTGTQNDPFNVQAIINYVSALQADVDTKQDYYVKGIVTSIPNNGISTQYNNVSFYISDDKAASNKFYVFRAKGLNGGDVTANMIKVGDEVVIFGSTWVNYRGNTPETKQGEAYIVSITSGEGGGETPTPTPSADGTNGDFESWTAGVPDNWTTSSSACNANLSQSTDAHGGKYSVKVAGASANKRLGYKEMQMKAGNYTLKFYAKAATAEGGSIRPGFVPVTDGAVGSYVYGDYVNDLSNSTWTLVEHSFTISDDGVYSIVIMNSKNPGKDVLIDDVTLTTGSTTVIKARRK